MIAANSTACYFDGLLMESLTANINVAEMLPRYTPDACNPGRFERVGMMYSKLNDATLSFQLWSHSLVTTHFMMDWLRQHRDRYHSHFVLLGTGYRCDYCGDYNPAATTTCWRCGATPERKPFSQVQQFPFYVTDITSSWGIVPDDEPTRIDVEMVGYGDGVDDSLDMMIAGAQIKLLPTGFALQPGFYLCAYCGGVVEDGKVCPGCGGNRIPWSELIQIHHKCVYCGHDVAGALVCTQCGARIAGTAYRQVFGDYQEDKNVQRHTTQVGHHGQRPDSDCERRAPQPLFDSRCQYCR